MRQAADVIATQPPASADRNATVSPVASGASGSRVIWSPLSAATMCSSSVRPLAAAASPSVAALTTAGSPPPFPTRRSAPKRCTVTSGAGELEQECRAHAVLGDEALDRVDERGPVGGRQRVGEAADVGKHDVDIRLERR